MRVALAQLNPVVGDLAGNRDLVLEAMARADSEAADVLVLPELVLTGYPPMDLLERDGFVRDQLRVLDEIEQASGRVATAVGAVLPVAGQGAKHLQNAAVLVREGRRIAVQAKTLLPTYDVFDEKRYFVPAEARKPVALAGGPNLGLSVCEDAWVDHVQYPEDPVADLAAASARLVLNLSASPWHVGKPAERRTLFSALAARCGVPIAFANQVGGNDELIFDGGSFVVDAHGRIVESLPLFETAFAVVDLEAPTETRAPEEIVDPEPVAQLERGLVLGIHDYFDKQRLPPGAVIAVSGGIDSAVTAHLAVRALGAEQVLGIAMPGPFSSEHSVSDAVALAERLGIELRKVDIRPIYEAYRNVFGQLFGVQDDYGLAQQNIQSRIRGAVLMAVSNAENRMVLATGNKSELSVGYCTLYGDTVGGLAVLGDVYKAGVYDLARHANAETERIPTNTIDKPPSAELAPDQLDTDDLPPYPVLDRVLFQAIEEGRGSDSIEPPAGATAADVHAIVRRLDRNEYKRRQSPLVLRVSEKAFGSGRRLPIVHRYHLG